MTGSRISCFLSICPRRPESGTEFRRESSGGGLQNRSIGRCPSPPSSWPGRELRKYHCPRCLSSPPPAAFRIPSHGRFPLVFQESWRACNVAVGIGNVPDDWLFSFHQNRFNGPGKKVPSPYNGHFSAVWYPTRKKTFRFFYVSPSSCGSRTRVLFPSPARIPGRPGCPACSFRRPPAGSESGSFETPPL